jgi:GNAT acetyltransferase
MIVASFVPVVIKGRNEVRYRYISWLDNSSERLGVLDGNDCFRGLFLSFHHRLQHSERIVMVLTDRTLLRLHVEAVWGVRLPPIVQNDIELLRESSRPSWQLWTGDIAGGRVHIWRLDVEPTEREALRLSANEALDLPPTATPIPSISREVAHSLTASPRLDIETACSIARPLTLRDRALVEAFQPGSCDYYFHSERRPLIGVVSAGQLLSLAHSSRRTKEACELGIDTLLEARRKGYALAATIVWTRVVMQEGLVPLYSAIAENTVSLRLAAAAGYRVFARAAIVEV